MNVESKVDWTKKRHESHSSLRRNLVDRLGDRRTDMAASVMELDPAIYTDPAHLKREQHAFQSLPIVACLSADIASPGDKLLFDALGPEIVLLRNREGQAKAFLNICPHRAARVVTSCDSRNTMTCRFHGWTFDLDGKLIGLPGAEGFAGLDRADRGLIEVPIAEWHGLIFVRLAPGAPIDVEEFLGDFADELRHLELEKARPIKFSRIDANANWKYAWDTYCESYHFASLHAATVAPRVISNVMAMQPLGRHARMGFARSEWRDLTKRPEAEWPKNDYGGNYFIFPNINVNVSYSASGQPFVGFYHVYPGASADRMVTRMMTYRPGDADGPEPDSEWADLHDYIEHVIRTEDYSVSEDGQRNLSNAPPGYRPVLGANEILVQKWHTDWAATLDQVSPVSQPEM